MEENLENMNTQLVELSTLKRIVEKQLEESLNSFREEREQKRKVRVKKRIRSKHGKSSNLEKIQYFFR